MHTKFYRKALLSSAIFVASIRVPFLNAGDNVGAIEVDTTKEKELAEGLADYAKRGVGGVTEINQSEYDELKKKSLTAPASTKPKELLRSMAEMPKKKKDKDSKHSASQSKPEADAAPAAPAEAPKHTTHAPAHHAEAERFKPHTKRVPKAETDKAE